MNEDIIARMLPYWIFGICLILVAIISGNKDTLRFEKKPILSWLKFLACISLLRIAIFYFAWDYFGGFADIAWIPLESTVTVFWEDAFYSLPLILMSRVLAGRARWLQIGSLVLLSIAFALGHIYQGYSAVFTLLLYVPLTLKYGKQYGVGTVMACHILFDFSTLGLVKLMMGYMNG